MSPDKHLEEVELTGKVKSGTFSKGSKSEHDSIYLETEQGSFVLRRKGANPFNDPLLNRLPGKTITAKGVINKYVFLVSEFKEKE